MRSLRLLSQREKSTSSAALELAVVLPFHFAGATNRDLDFCCPGQELSGSTAAGGLANRFRRHLHSGTGSRAMAAK